MRADLHKDGPQTVKSSTETSQAGRMARAPREAGPDRGQWQRWVETLRKFRLDGLVTWFLDAGRPFAVVSAQFMYMTSPFVGKGAESIGRMLESDEDSEAFAGLLASPARTMGQTNGEPTR